MPLAPTFFLTASLLAFDVLKTDALAARIAEVSGRAKGGMLIAAAGGDAARALARLQRDSGAKWDVERVPLMGDVDTEMAHVLTSNKVRCGLRVAPGGMEGEWIVSEHGDCGNGVVQGTDDAGWLGSADSGHKAHPTDPAAPLTPTPQAELDPTTLLLLDHTVPDPTAALLSSAIVGFGAGHFYAHDPSAGWWHAGLQAGGLVIFGLGELVAEQAFESDGVTAGHAISVGGMVLFVGSRLVDAATAPEAAQIDARRQIERQLR